MTTQEWIDHVMRGQEIWCIGQIDKPTRRALERLVKQGKLYKSRESFCYISPPKTVFRLA